MSQGFGQKGPGKHCSWLVNILIHLSLTSFVSSLFLPILYYTMLCYAMLSYCAGCWQPVDYILPKYLTYLPYLLPSFPSAFFTHALPSFYPSSFLPFHLIFSRLLSLLLSLMFSDGRRHQLHERYTE